MPDLPPAMLREIHEQPQAIRRTLDLYLNGHALSAQAFAPLADWLNPRGEGTDCRQRFQPPRRLGRRNPL